MILGVMRTQTISAINPFALGAFYKTGTNSQAVNGRNWTSDVWKSGHDVVCIGDVIEQRRRDMRSDVWVGIMNMIRQCFTSQSTVAGNTYQGSNDGLNAHPIGKKFGGTYESRGF